MEQILDAPTTSDIQLKYAGFWIRVAASLIDGIIVATVSYGVIYATGGDFMRPNWATYVFNYLIGPAYYILMESSAKQATLGKQAVGIVVGDENGNRITIVKALGRYLSKILSALIIGIGFLMVGWDEKKQGLHDKICSTYVFYK